LVERAFGEIAIESCRVCRGSFLDTVSFEKVIRARGENGAFDLPPDPPASAGRSTDVAAYVRCPDCRNLMNRHNYARISGVIVDICRAHGIWFDRDELRQLLEFAKAGGLERSKKREIEELEEKRRTLAAEVKRARSADIYAASPYWNPRELTGLDLVVDVLGDVVTSLLDPF
jgi:Zn-finger nucleic acid-binding protein